MGSVWRELDLIYLHELERRRVEAIEAEVVDLRGATQPLSPPPHRHPATDNLSLAGARTGSRHKG